MTKKLIALAAIGLLLPTTVLAQSQAQGTKKAEENRQLSDGKSLPQQIQQTLKDDGYTNVNVVPGSYVVTAKNKRGNPVTMIIGPHSMTMLTAIPGSESSGKSTTGAQADQGDSKTK